MSKSVFEKIKSSVWGKDAGDELVKEEALNRKDDTVTLHIDLSQKGQARQRRARSRRAQKRKLEAKRALGRFAAADGKKLGDEFSDDEDEKKDDGRRSSDAVGRAKDDGEDEDEALEEVKERIITDEQRARQEQEDRENEQEEARKRLLAEMGIGEEEEEEILEGSFKYSPEKWAASWAFLTALIYFIFAFGGLFIGTTSYDKRPCEAGTDPSGSRICLGYNATHHCANFDFVDPKITAGGVAALLCSSTCQGTGAAGCLYADWKPTEDNFYYCVSENVFLDPFPTGCLDTLTCLDSDEDSIKQAALFIGILHVFNCLVELTTGLGLWSYSGLYYEDFPSSYQDATRLGKCAFAVMKSGGYLLQVLFVFGVIAEAYYCVQTFAIASECSGAVTSTGEPNTFSDDTNAFAQANGGLLFITLLLGTIVRHKFKVRGELFSPSFDNEVKPPCNIDCAIQRAEHEPPKFCHDTCESFGKCMKECGIPKIIYQVIVRFMDLVAWPILLIGSKFGWLYKHRHFIGP